MDERRLARTGRVSTSMPAAGATKLDVMAAPAPGGMMVRPKTTRAHIASEDTSEV
jgi:hypothetical protein